MFPKSVLFRNIPNTSNEDVSDLRLLTGGTLNLVPVCDEGSIYWEEIIPSAFQIQQGFLTFLPSGCDGSHPLWGFLKNIDDTVDAKNPANLFIW